MIITPCKEPFSPKSARYYCRIHTDVCCGWILVGEYNLEKILTGDIQFIPNPHHPGGIGTLKIGYDEIPCLEREFIADWHNCVRKLCSKILGITDKLTIEQAVKNQP